MKKSLFLLTLLMSILTFAQDAFTRQYDSVSYLSKTTGTFEDKRKDSFTIFNYKNTPVTVIYVDDIKVTLKHEGRVKHGISEGNQYYKIIVFDGIERGYLVIFEKENLGFLLIMPSSVVGFFNSEKNYN